MKHWIWVDLATGMPIDFWGEGRWIYSKTRFAASLQSQVIDVTSDPREGTVMRLRKIHLCEFHFEAIKEVTSTFNAVTQLCKRQEELERNKISYLLS